MGALVKKNIYGPTKVGKYLHFEEELKDEIRKIAEEMELKISQFLIKGGCFVKPLVV